MPRNDEKGADEGGKRPDIPSRPKIRLLAGPSNDGRGAEPDGKRPKQPSPFEPHFLGGSFRANGGERGNPINAVVRLRLSNQITASLRSSQ